MTLGDTGLNLCSLCESLWSQWCPWFVSQWLTLDQYCWLHITSPQLMVWCALFSHTAGLDVVLWWVRRSSEGWPRWDNSALQIKCVFLSKLNVFCVCSRFGFGMLCEVKFVSYMEMGKQRVRWNGRKRHHTWSHVMVRWRFCFQNIRGLKYTIYLINP